MSKLKTTLNPQDIVVEQYDFLDENIIEVVLSNNEGTAFDSISISTEFLFSWLGSNLTENQLIAADEVEILRLRTIEELIDIGAVNEDVIGKFVREFIELADISISDFKIMEEGEKKVYLDAVSVIPKDERKIWADVLINFIYGSSAEKPRNEWIRAYAYHMKRKLIK